ncbi:MAG: hypothetical protein JXR96_04855 [Deltaproteobacteria bacterium]|nr:hypothetical protein [Deltaproteobacteria bacterium]
MTDRRTYQRPEAWGPIAIDARNEENVLLRFPDGKESIRRLPIRRVSIENIDRQLDEDDDARARRLEALTILEGKKKPDVDTEDLSSVPENIIPRYTEADRAAASIPFWYRLLDVGEWRSGARAGEVARKNLAAQGLGPTDEELRDRLFEMLVEGGVFTEQFASVLAKKQDPWSAWQQALMSQLGRDSIHAIHDLVLRTHEVALRLELRPKGIDIAQYEELLGKETSREVVTATATTTAQREEQASSDARMLFPLLSVCEGMRRLDAELVLAEHYLNDDFQHDVLALRAGNRSLDEMARRWPAACWKQHRPIRERGPDDPFWMPAALAQNKRRRGRDVTQPGRLMFAYWILRTQHGPGFNIDKIHGDDIARAVRIANLHHIDPFKALCRFQERIRKHSR